MSETAPGSGSGFALVVTVSPPSSAPPIHGGHPVVVDPPATPTGRLPLTGLDAVTLLLAAVLTLAAGMLLVLLARLHLRAQQRGPGEPGTSHLLGPN